MNSKLHTSDSSFCRTFIALPLSPEMANLINLWLKNWRLLNSGINWSTEGQLHFTLVFLGGIPETSLEKIIEICRAAAMASRAFAFRMGELGIFPARGDGHVLWIGLSEGAKAMTEIQDELSRSLREAGFALETREFVPHLTLGRSKPGAKIQRTWVERDTQDLQALEDAAKEILVMKSELSPGGAQHTVLARCPLG
jgi:2'-5' RNA ligase